MAINTALNDIKNGALDPIPPYLKTNANGYKYPHDFSGWVKQTYLTHPKSYYHTQQIAFEKTLYTWHEKIIKS